MKNLGHILRLDLCGDDDIQTAQTSVLARECPMSAVDMTTAC